MTFKPKYTHNQEYLQHKIKYGAPISVRLNDLEFKMVHSVKKDYHIDANGTVLKNLAKVGYAVLQNENPHVVVSELFIKKHLKKVATSKQKEKK